jgi:anti-sigma regulatory factor (Ser/Thr protein kinase)
MARWSPQRLLVSEVVTNAVCHGRGMIMLRADLDEVRVRVEVDDERIGFERVVRQRDFYSSAVGV